MKTIQKVALFYTEGTSDKEYHVHLDEVLGGFTVTGFNGRRGATLIPRPKTLSPVSREEAEKIFNKLVAKQEREGYTRDESGIAYAGTDKADRKTGILPQLLREIELHEVPALLRDPAYGLMYKANGERVLIRKIGDDMCGINRKGLQRPLPIAVQQPIAARNGSFTLDGELVGDTYFVFDMLTLSDQDLRLLPFLDRHRTAVETVTSIANESITYIPLITDPDEKAERFAHYRDSGEEGVVLKVLASSYTSGRPASGGPALKYKFVQSATCIVQKRNDKRSIALALYDGKRLVDVGNCTIPANVDFASIEPGATVEIRYLRANPGGSLVEPVFLGIRSDLEAEECTTEQLESTV